MFVKTTTRRRGDKVYAYLSLRSTATSGVAAAGPTLPVPPAASVDYSGFTDQLGVCFPEAWSDMGAERYALARSHLDQSYGLLLEKVFSSRGVHRAAADQQWSECVANSDTSDRAT